MRVNGESGFARPTAHVRRWVVPSMRRRVPSTLRGRFLDHDIVEIERTSAVKRLKILERLRFQIQQVDKHQFGENDEQSHECRCNT